MTCALWPVPCDLWPAFCTCCTGMQSKGPSTPIRIFFNHQLFLCGYAFHPHVSSKFAGESRTFWIRSPEWVLLNPTNMNPEPCGRQIRIIFYPGDVTRLSPSPYCKINSQDGCRLLHGTCSLFPWGVLSSRVNLDTFQICVEGKIRFEDVYGNIFESGKKKLGIRKYPKNSLNWLQK